MTEAALVERLLDVIENDIVPKTAEGVSHGNKLFGAAILRKDDRSLVIAETNNQCFKHCSHVQSVGCRCSSEALNVVSTSRELCQKVIVNFLCMTTAHLRSDLLDDSFSVRSRNFERLFLHPYCLTNFFHCCAERVVGQSINRKRIGLKRFFYRADLLEVWEVLSSARLSNE